MNDAFFLALKTRLAELVADLRFRHRPTNRLIAPQIVDVMLDRPTSEVEEGEEYPFVRWKVTGGEFDRPGRVHFTVVLDAGLYTDGDCATGNAAIASMALALGRIVERPVFTPYRLEGPARFTVGDQVGEGQRSPGLQPHPYYHCQLSVDFVMMAGRAGTA